MTDLTVDAERADWLRALRSMNDAYVLRLLDEHTRLMRAQAWAEGRRSHAHANPYGGVA